MTRHQRRPLVRLVIGALLLLPPVVQGQGAAAAPPARLEAANRYIVTFSATYESRTPADRASASSARIAALTPAQLTEPVTQDAVEVGDTKGIIVSIGGAPVFYLLPGDVEPGQTLERTAADAMARLQSALRARADQQRWPVILRGVAKTGLATLLAVLAIVAVVRIGRAAHAPLQRLVDTQTAHTPWVHPVIRERATLLLDTAVTLMARTSYALIGFFWLAYTLRQFPVVAPWGDTLSERIFDLFGRLGAGVLSALPGLFIAALIVAAARALSNFSIFLFGLVASGAIRIPWLHPDTAQATQRLTVMAIWLAAAVAAYPYIPGSETDAFKGLTILVGLLASLGSTGVAAQAMSGLSVIYARVLRPGELVRIDELEGEVISVGLLATKLMTIGKEEITVPNSVLVSTSTVNYSRLASTGAVVSTRLGIGYDAPWRQVHALLQLAATRTEGIASNPEPRVFQRQLRTFDIEYVMYAFVSPGASRPRVLSELHAQVQDAFNEFGVQIMTPAYESQPERDVVVPRTRWFSAPAVPRDRPAAPLRHPAAARGVPGSAPERHPTTEG